MADTTGGTRSLSMSSASEAQSVMGLVSDKVRQLLKQKRRVRARLRRMQARNAPAEEIAELKAEFQDMTGVLHELKADEATKAFVLFDKDRSGALSLEEFSALAMRLDPSLDTENVRKEFVSIDLNDDNKVTLSEFTRWWVSFAPDNVMRQKLKSALLKKYLHSKVSSDKQKEALAEFRASAMDLRLKLRKLKEGALSSKTKSAVREMFSDLRDDVHVMLDEHTPAMSYADDPSLSRFFPYFTGVYDSPHIVVSLQAASVEAIVRKLLQPGHEDPWLQTVFFMTHRRYLPSTLLLKLLVQRFFSFTTASVGVTTFASELSLPDTPIDPQGMLGGSGGPIPSVATLLWSQLAYGEGVRLKTLLFLCAWITTTFSDLEDKNLATVVRGFLDSVLSAKSASVASGSPSATLAEHLRTVLADAEAAAEAAAAAPSYNTDLIAAYAVDPVLPPNTEVSALLDLSPYEWARQLTLLDFEAFSRINPHEFMKHQQRDALAPFLNTFFQRSLWVASEVLGASLSQTRAQVIAAFIDIAHCCHVLDNYASMMAILVALASEPVARLTETFAYLPPDSRSRLRALQRFTNPADAFRSYRDAMASVSAPAVPFVHPYELVIVDIEASSNTHVGNAESLVNLAKFDELTRVISRVLSFQSGSYAIVPLDGARNYITSYNAMTRSQLMATSRNLKPLHADDAAEPSVLANPTQGVFFGPDSGSAFSPLADSAATIGPLDRTIDPYVATASKPVLPPSALLSPTGDSSADASPRNTADGLRPSTSSTIVGGLGPIPKAIRPLRAQVLSILDLHPLEVARQLSLVCHKIASRLKSEDWTSTVVRDGRARLFDRFDPPGLDRLFLGKSTSFPEGITLASSAMLDLYHHMLHIVTWVQSLILLSSPAMINAATLIATSEAVDPSALDVVLVERIHALCSVIDVAHACFLLGNFADLGSILYALRSPPLQRLTLTWSALPPFYAHKLLALEHVLSPSPTTSCHSDYDTALRCSSSAVVVFPDIHLERLHAIYNDVVVGSEARFSKHPDTLAELKRLGALAARPYRFRELAEVVEFILNPPSGIISQNEALAAAIKLEPDGYVPSKDSGAWMCGPRMFQHNSQVHEQGYELAGILYSGSTARPRAGSAESPVSK